MYRMKKPRPKEPEQTPFPKTYESEASAAANQKRLHDSLNEWDYDESEAPVQPELINIEFSRLAACFMRAAKNDPELAHKKAWEFLKAGFNYFPPPPLGTDIMAARLRRISRADDAEWRAWKLDTELPISFAMAAQADWPNKRHKTERGMISLLKRVGYPPFFLLHPGGLINRSAYEIAVQRDDKARKERDARRHREARKTKEAH
jgi:hypothetical protein